MEEKCVCNFCGKEMDEWDKQQGIAIHTKLKYGSEHDGEHIAMNFCNECFDHIINACVVSPFIGEEI